MLTALSLLPLLLQSPPNVILITVDDMNDWVGCLDGHPQARTPNIDALARRGTLFTNAHCQAPVCTPSRASLFTGRLPSTTGMYFLQPALTQVTALAEVRTLVGRFSSEGYETLGVGKLHHGGGEGGYFQTYGGALGGFGPRPEEKLAYPDGHPLWDWGPYPASDAEMPDSKVADWAIERLGEPREDPFLLAVGFWRPHVPMCVPEHWFECIEGPVTLPPVLEGDVDDLPLYATQLTVGHPAPRHTWMVENDAWRDAVHAYLASCAFVDDQIGRLLGALKSSQHATNTLVVLLSDHGFHLGEKERWAKRSLWEESTRVPLILAGPGVEISRCGAPVGLVDVYPTLLDLCGLEADGELDGHSLSPLLRGETWPHGALTTFGPGNHSVRTEEWRYIRYADGSEELYAHPKDPHEWHNLASDPAHAATCASLRKLLPANDAPPVPGTAGAGWDAMQAATR